MSAAWRPWPSDPETPSRDPSPLRHRPAVRAGPVPPVALSRGTNQQGHPMPKRPPPPAAGPRNRFLARLPDAEYRRLLPLLKPVELGAGQVLYESRGPVEHAYFPTDAVLSALTVMQDGNAI